MIAFILLNLEPKQSGQILSLLPEDKQICITKRITEIINIKPFTLQVISKRLRKKLKHIKSPNSLSMKSTGIDKVVDILSTSNSKIEKSIYDKMKNENPKLAEEIRRRMFVFEDIVSS